MARTVNRGDIWTYRFARPDQRRPVAVLTRQEVIPLLRTIMVAPITSTVPGAPSEVAVGPEHGLQQESVVNVDHVRTVKCSLLKRRIGLGPEETRKVCSALAVAVRCGG